MTPKVRLTAVAGGAGGSWYVLMEGLARLVGEVHPDIRIDVVEGGGVSNHARVGSGAVVDSAVHSTRGRCVCECS